jgi:ADP-ribose pyrophosphatase
VPLAFAESESAEAVSSAGLVRGVGCVELVAGILERGEVGIDALRARAVAEAHEEAGLTVAADKVTLLGAPLYASPGMCTEQFHFAVCQVRDPSSAEEPEGDGSPFEEGARLVWRDLDEAIAACVRGEIADLKTEVALRRLRDSLGE